jgi:hypothetical protein
MAGLPAHFLGSQGVHDAMLLPEVINLKNHSGIEDFKPKSLKDNFHNLIFVLTKAVFDVL